MNFKLFIVFMVLSSTIFSQNSKGAKKAPATVKKTAPLPPPRIIVPANYGSVQDIDGNTYRTIKIGEQTWMADNLKVTRFNDGSVLEKITDISNYVLNNNESGTKSFPSWNYYENDKTNNLNYGKLYNFAVINLEINNGRNICPVGWHVPSKNDFEVLFNTLGGIEKVDNYLANMDAGKKLKSKDFWKLSETPGQNSFYFNALPGGCGIIISFESKDEIGTYWSSSNSIIGETWCLNLFHDDDLALIQSMPNLHTGYSIRCLQD